MNKRSLVDHEPEDVNEKLRTRYKEQDRSVTYSLREVKICMNQINEEGMFSTINYNKLSNGISLSSHLYYATKMAAAYVDQKGDLYLDSTLKNKIDLLIKKWTDNQYQCDGWYHNQIAIPT